LGREEILSEVDLELPRGSRAVVVGPNGSGKTTLLKVVAGIEEIVSGDFTLGVQSIGWLKQESVSGSKKTVYEEAISQMPAKDAEGTLQQAEDAYAAVDGEDEETVQAAQKQYDKATAEYAAAGGFEMQQRATEVLTGLNFTQADYSKPISELSGGCQMRVALARALLSAPELCC